MRFVRSLLLLIYFILYTVPYATACFIAFPFMRPDARYWMAAAGASRRCGSCAG